MQEVRRQINRSFVGLAGESRTNDANTPWFRIGAVSPTNLTLTPPGGRPPVVEPLPPVDANTPPSHRPDVPCETQQPPDLAAPSAPGGSFNTFSGAARRANAAKLQKHFKSDKFKKMAERASQRGQKKGAKR